MSCRDSQRGFGRLDFEILLRSYLKSCRDSQRVFGRRDFEISSRSRPRILTRFWDLGENLGGFLATEILRSRQDLVEDLEDLNENLGEFLVAEISPRSRQSRRPKTRRDLGQNFAGVLVDIHLGSMYQILNSTYRPICIFLHQICLIRLKQKYIFISRKHQRQITADEQWNERNEGKTGHLDCHIGREQRWR